jgi:hypothetical protein
VVHVEPNQVGAEIGARAAGLTDMYAHAPQDLLPALAPELHQQLGGALDIGEEESQRLRGHAQSRRILWASVLAASLDPLG